jgi:outer membrane immunogenic protein
MGTGEMKLLSGILGLTLASVVAFGFANAADVYVPATGGGYKDTYVPVASWTGFYAGVNAGYGWNANGDQFAEEGTFGLNAKGGFGGGQIGYNWQGILHPHLVLGVEADIQGSDISDKINFGFGEIGKNSLDWFGTIRGRIGYAFDASLVYFTGGFAYGGMNNADFEFKKSDTATGYVLGGGYEYKFTPAWSLKAEYQYINLGKNDPTFDGFLLSDQGIKVNDDAFHTLRVGLNYHIAPGYEPLK